MNANVVPLDTDEHHAVQTLLPWYLSGRLDRPEVEQVEAHLAGCARCQSELAWERRMSAAQAALGSDAGDVEHGWTRLRQALAASTGGAPSRPASRPRRLRDDWRAGAPWLRWTLGAQFAAVLVLITLVVAPHAPDETYHALGSAGHTSAGNMVVRFRPDATEREIRMALKGAGARLVGGPTATDAYLLSVPVDREAAALATLRATPIVALVESRDGSTRR